MDFEEIRELKTHKEEFIKILKDIILWEKEYKKYPEEDENYKIRKTISELPSDKLKITFLKLDTSLYYVVVKYNSLQGEISTSWIHEDEIFRERQLYFNNKKHISHTIVCLTDLYEIAEPILDKTKNKKIA